MRLLSIPLALVGLALFGVATAAQSPDRAITSAALAPYRDELLRDAPALCSDLARSPRIVPSTLHRASCDQAVQSVFAATTSPSLPRDVVLSLHATVSHLEIKGHRATGIFSLNASEPASNRRTHAVKVVSLGRYQLSLEEITGRWLVSTQARLAAVGDCQLNPHGHCQPGVKDLVFILGVPVGRTVGSRRVRG